MDVTMNKPLHGRTALVTGAGSGIGRQLALELAAQGAKVGVGVRRLNTGEETVQLVRAEGGVAIPIEMDVTDEQAVTNGMETLVKEFSSLDIVIHNANHGSSAYPAPADESLTRETWQTLSRVSLGGAFLTAKTAYPYLKQSDFSRLIFMSSTFGYHGAAMNTIYAAQKSAFRGLFKSLAREWGEDGIRVNGICPAAMTEVTEVFFNQNPVMKTAYMEKFPLGHMGRPREDIARAISTLCGDALGYMSGHVFFLDGGMYPAG